MQSLTCMNGSVTATKFFWASTCMVASRTKTTWGEFAGSADGWTAAELEKEFFSAVLSSHVCRTRDSSNRTTCVVRLDAWKTRLNWSQVLAWRGTFPVPICSFLIFYRHVRLVLGISSILKETMFHDWLGIMFLCLWKRQGRGKCISQNAFEQ